MSGVNHRTVQRAESAEYENAVTSTNAPHKIGDAIAEAEDILIAKNTQPLIGRHGAKFVYNLVVRAALGDPDHPQA